MAAILKGAPAAAALTEELSARTQALKARGVTPCLAILRLGERPDDLSYERAAIKRCETIGLRVERFVLDESSSQEQVEAVLRRINEDASIHGCLMFRPLPAHLKEDALCELLLPEKVEEFDRQFPPKEKAWMPSQEKFYIYSHSTVG